jgi:SAM-dependent methyltransferase
MTAPSEAAPATNAEQANFWNGDMARRWLAHETEMETLAREPTAALVDAIGACPGMRLLEVGCGSGGLAIQLAQAVGPEGRVTALDISVPLLDRARERAKGLANIDFRLADAQVAPLPEAAFDLILSNFGIMFFEDPVAAFSNLRRSLRPGGKLVFACFGSPARNQWFALPRAAAVARLGAPPVPPPGAPGPMAFADNAHVTSLLRTAGYRDCAAEARMLDWVHPGGPEAAARLATDLGPAAFVIRDRAGSAADRDAIRADIGRAFAPYADAGGVRLPVEVLLYRAANP